MAVSSGNATHDANAIASEMLRMQDLGPARLQDHSWPSVPGQVSVFAPPVTAAAARQADINHFRRLLASAIATGVSPSTYINALQSLGASLYA